MNRILYTIFVLLVVLSACSEETDVSDDAQTKTVTFSPRIESSAAAPQTLYVYAFKNVDFFSYQNSGSFSGVSIPLYYHENYMLVLTTAPALLLDMLTASVYIRLTDSPDAAKKYSNVAPYMQHTNTNLFYKAHGINNVSSLTPSTVTNLVLERIEAKVTVRFTPQANETKAYLRALYSYGSFTLTRVKNGTLKTTIGDEVALVASTNNEVSVRFIPYNDSSGAPVDVAAGRSFILHVFNKQLNQWIDYSLRLADGIALSPGNNYVFNQSGTQLVFEPTLVESWGTEIVLGTN